MVIRYDYGKKEVDTCLSVLVELMTTLGEFRDNIVLVGGWIPYFLMEENRHEHVGSLDIDIALDFQKISEDTYQTILQALKSKGYERGKQPFIFYRTIPSEDGEAITVEVDLLTGEYGGTGKSHRTQSIQDVRARKTRGCDLVFKQNRSLKIAANMPNGAFNEVTIKIANVIPFIVMKGMCMWDRYKEKDAYDIYFTTLHYPGGINEMVKIFQPFKSNKLVREGLGKIKAKFKNIDAPGLVWLTNFEDIDDEEEKERVKRDAYERVNAFLDALRIEEFKER
jgi:hypothetical protein